MEVVALSKKSPDSHCSRQWDLVDRQPSMFEGSESETAAMLGSSYVFAGRGAKRSLCSANIWRSKFDFGRCVCELLIS